MDRRQFLRTVPVAAAVAVAGCSEIQSPSAEQGLGSEDNCWSGIEAAVTAESASEIRESVDIPVPVVLTGAGVQTGFFESEDSAATLRALREAEFEVRSARSIQWCGEPICEVKSKVSLPATPSEDEIESAFPDAVRITMTASVSGDRFWTIYSRVTSTDDISASLDELPVDGDSATFAVYRGCDHTW
jgi:hypothetical protein